MKDGVKFFEAITPEVEQLFAAALERAKNAIQVITRVTKLEGSVQAAVAANEDEGSEFNTAANQLEDFVDGLVLFALDFARPTMLAVLEESGLGLSSDLALELRGEMSFLPPDQMVSDWLSEFYNAAFVDQKPKPEQLKFED